ncbi:MAG TPA: AAA family ATPase [Chitinophagales bacterium]|nr:AAA family ATPase [Chitinophagales bacterium]
MPNLPFAIRSLSVENYQGIAQATIEDLPPDARWIFLTGRNGYGKTSVLQAIAIGLYGRRAIRTYTIPTSARISIGFLHNNAPKTRKQDSSAKPFKHIVTYGASRLQLQAEEAQEDVGRRSTAIYGLFHVDGLMLNIERELVLWHLEGNKRFEAVKSLFLSLIPDLSAINIEGRKVKYIEKDPENENYSAVSFEQLASGFRNIIGFIGDMLVKFYRVQTAVVNPSDFKGIVIIDELDLHLHPSMQSLLVEKLTTAFPYIQFIVSTHSAIPFLGIPQGVETVFLRVDRTKAEGIKIERVNIDLPNMTPNLILSSPLLGFTDIIPNSNTNLNELRTEDTYQQLLREQEIDKMLQHYAAHNDLDQLFNPPIKP